MKKEIGIIGLGKMGSGLALNLIDHHWEAAGYNRSPDATQELEGQGLTGAYSIEELVGKLDAPRLVWLMVPAGDPVDQVLFGDQGLVQHLEKNDVVIDGGNSFFENTIKRAERLKQKGIRFLDAGVSGGPAGARQGACIMVGGGKELFDEYEQLFADLSVEDGYGHFGSSGAGHFVKMVHNGIEYGMMQAIAEGFTVLKESEFDLELGKVTEVYNHGSVVESRLIGWLYQAFDDWGVDLESIAGRVSHSGEGEWTVQTAKKMGIPVEIIEKSFQFRVSSQDNPSYTGRIVSALRGQFGSHDVRE